MNVSRYLSTISQLPLRPSYWLFRVSTTSLHISCINIVDALSGWRRPVCTVVSIESKELLGRTCFSIFYSSCIVKINALSFLHKQRHLMHVCSLKIIAIFFLINPRKDFFILRIYTYGENVQLSVDFFYDRQINPYYYINSHSFTLCTSHEMTLPFSYF